MSSQDRDSTDGPRSPDSDAVDSENLEIFGLLTDRGLVLSPRFTSSHTASPRLRPTYVAAQPIEPEQVEELRSRGVISTQKEIKAAYIGDIKYWSEIKRGGRTKGWGLNVLRVLGAFTAVGLSIGVVPPSQPPPDVEYVLVTTHTEDTIEDPIEDPISGLAEIDQLVHERIIDEDEKILGKATTHAEDVADLSEVIKILGTDPEQTPEPAYYSISFGTQGAPPPPGEKPPEASEINFAEVFNSSPVTYRAVQAALFHEYFHVHARHQDWRSFEGVFSVSEHPIGREDLIESLHEFVGNEWQSESSTPSGKTTWQSVLEDGKAIVGIVDLAAERGRNVSVNSVIDELFLPQKMLINSWLQILGGTYTITGSEAGNFSF